jgi:D-alanyl-D-alanine carboxypeptidase
MSGGLEGEARGVKPDVIIKSVSAPHESGKSGRRGHAALNTGYCRASGFGLVTSVERGDMKMIGVILGKDPASARDQRKRRW